MLTARFPSAVPICRKECEIQGLGPIGLDFDDDEAAFTIASRHLQNVLSGHTNMVESMLRSCWQAVSFRASQSCLCSKFQSQVSKEACRGNYRKHVTLRKAEICLALTRGR